MPRCPDYLNPNDFDKLATSVGLQLSDTGVSALGEIAEYISIQLLKLATNHCLDNGPIVLDKDAIICAANKLGIEVVEVNTDQKTLSSAHIVVDKLF